MTSRVVEVDNHRWEVVERNGCLDAWLLNVEEDEDSVELPWLHFTSTGRSKNAAFFRKNMAYKVLDCEHMVYYHPDKPVLPDRTKFESSTQTGGNSINGVIRLKFGHNTYDVMKV